MFKNNFKFSILILGIIIPAIVFAQTGTPTSPNGTTTSTTTTQPTSDAALTLYPTRTTNTTILSPTTNTTAPTDTTTTSPAPIAVQTTTTTTPGNTTGSTSNSPTNSSTNIPTIQPLTTDQTAEACPSITESAVPSCNTSPNIFPFVPWLVFGTAGIGFILFLIIIFYLYNSRNQTLKQFAGRAEKLNFKNFQDKQSLNASLNMFDFLNSQNGSNQLNLNKFNKIASQLEIVGNDQIRNFIPKLREAFQNNETQKLTELNLQFKELLKSQINQ